MTDTTNEEVYDFLVSAGYKEPAVLCLGERYILGQWWLVDDMSKAHIILRTHEEAGLAVKVLGEGGSWITALRAAGLWQEFVAWKWKSASRATYTGSEATSGIRQKTVKE